MDGFITGGDQNRASYILRRYANAEKFRGNWEYHWEEIARRVIPQYSHTFTNRDMQLSQGQRRTEEMVDATAALALPKFAAAMESMLTPRNSTWHRVRPMDKKLLANRTVREYYDAVNEALFRYRYATPANYASQQHEIYMALGAFGTGCLYVDALDSRFERGLRYRAIHLGEIYFLENHQGIIDTAIRRFPLTPRQAVQKFKYGLPPEFAEYAADPGKMEDPFWFYHYVGPREDEGSYDPDRRDAAGMRYLNEYVCEKGLAIVREGELETGFHTFPYAISRYVVAPGEVYGRSPCMLALPAIKVINEMEKTVLKQGHRVVDPVLLAHDDGVVDAFNMRPGAVNFGGVSADGKPLVHVLPTGNLAIAKEMMEAKREVINDALLVTLFQILIDTPQMTATEVLERAREKGALLSPTMGRQQSEALGPMVDREIDVLNTQGLLPQMPLIVRQMRAEYETVYDSPLSRAQRAEQATGLMQLVNWAKDIIQVTQDPSPLDHVNWDSAMPDLGDISAVPFKWMNDPATIAQIRDARAKQQQIKQATDAGPAIGGIAKALPQLKTSLSGNAQ